MNSNHHSPSFHSPRPGTHIVSLCCGCGQIRLYSPGSPCMLCNKQKCNYFAEYPLQQAWDNCSECGPLSCNLILELSKEQDKLKLIRCCWCKSTKICQDKCDTCGKKGCCREAKVHPSRIYHQIKARHVADAVNSRKDSTNPILRKVGPSKSIEEDAQDEANTEPVVPKIVSTVSIKQEVQDEVNVFLRGGGPDIQLQLATPRKLSMTPHRLLQLLTTPSQTRRRDGDKFSVELVWRGIQKYREKRAKQGIPPKAEETKEKFSRGYGDVSGNICYWNDIESDENEEKLQPVRVARPRDRRHLVWRIEQGSGNKVKLHHLLREHPIENFQNRLEMLENAGILEAAHHDVHPNDDLTYRLSKALEGPPPAWFEELSTPSLYSGAEAHAHFRMRKQNKSPYGYGPRAEKVRQVLLNLAVNKSTTPDEWLRTLPVLFELEKRRKLAMQRAFDPKAEKAEDEWLRIFGGFGSSERLLNPALNDFIGLDEKGIWTGRQVAHPRENFKRSFISVGVDESESSKRMRIL